MLLSIEASGSPLVWKRSRPRLRPETIVSRCRFDREAAFSARGKRINTEHLTTVVERLVVLLSVGWAVVCPAKTWRMIAYPSITHAGLSRNGL